MSREKLLEMSASVWAMEHYTVYLQGKYFVLYTDHNPLVNLGTIHTKTLSRMQEAMNTYNFEIIYQKGSEMPADYLSQNVVESIQIEDGQMEKAQDTEEWISDIKNWMLN
jgi:recombinational DNA repair protein RecR